MDCRMHQKEIAHWSFESIFSSEDVSLYLKCESFEEM